jgi:predicted DNA-binding helix-hairpin-helix protein
LIANIVEPDELAGLFDYLHKLLKLAGLFLSSGVAGDPDKVTESALTAEGSSKN